MSKKQQKKQYQKKNNEPTNDQKIINQINSSGKQNRSSNFSVENEEDMVNETMVKFYHIQQKGTIEAIAINKSNRMIVEDYEKESSICGLMVFEMLNSLTEFMIKQVNETPKNQ